MQFDKGHKGFSFSKEGPLDMRMDPSSDLTAEEVVNRWSEKQLADVLRKGEEPHWRRVAQALVAARKKKPIQTTTELAEIIASASGKYSKKKLHPATLAFQALRLCVNRELESLQEGISKALGKLSQGGRIGVLSFQSLEDRIVKNLFRDAATPPPRYGQARKEIGPLLHLLTKKPLVPSAKEVQANPRSRSAKMRFAERN